MVLQEATCEGIESHLDAEFRVDGSLCLAEKKQGPRLEQQTGEDVSEYFLTVEPVDLPKLSAALRREAGEGKTSGSAEVGPTEVLGPLRQLYAETRFVGLGDFAEFLDRSRVPYERYSA